MPDQCSLHKTASHQSQDESFMWRVSKEVEKNMDRVCCSSPYLRWGLAVAGGEGGWGMSCIDVTLTGRVERWGFTSWLTAPCHVSELRGEVLHLSVKERRSKHTHPHTHTFCINTHVWSSCGPVQRYILWSTAVREWQATSEELSRTQTSTEPPEGDTHVETPIKAQTLTFVCTYMREHILHVTHFLLCARYLLLLLLRQRALQLSLAPDWLLSVWRVVHSGGSVRVQEWLPWEEGGSSVITYECGVYKNLTGIYMCVCVC